MRVSSYAAQAPVDRRLHASAPALSRRAPARPSRSRPARRDRLEHAHGEPSRAGAPARVSTITVERPRHDRHDRDACAAIASRNAPLLNGRSVPLWLRCPSGMNQTAIFSSRIVARRVVRATASALRACSRSMMRFPGEPVEPSEDGDPPDLALAGGDRPRREDRTERHDVQEALVVADDDAGPVLVAGARGSSTSISQPIIRTRPRQKTRP